MVPKNLLLSLGVMRAERRAASLPPFHKMVGRKDIEEQLCGVAFQLAENLRGELVVLLAEASDPCGERELSPANEMIREAY